MKKLLTTTVMAASISALTLTGCSSTTNTGAVGVDRQQLLLVSSEQVLQLSAQSYAQTLQEANAKGVLNTNQAQVNRLKTIANRLIGQVGVYRPDAAQWDWEVHTIKSDQLNAFVMPGGKIMFYSGIIDRLNLTDDEIAAIMGHEISHALREHSRERMSREYATQTSIGLAASIFGLSQGQAQIANVAGDLGLSRPHSRTQESEADQIGLELMARAGYNPQAAISLWQKMQNASEGEPPQFLSTHPSSSSRISDMQSLMPKVMPLYQQSRR
ncbi:M48 family metallopeptidase [Psychrobacter sp.]|uniref:M48 family metallopeptidase n=1 Tax=Psychrobacter sp. TaxID=56811 RepID=UPI002647C81F|nr:M48 family metallopeptidase [Psychrobacter sp.]MDN6276568.1 M48 family metallopeptidase [Psychrobacter sp.]MDN6308846.1 M48 family metallopeptidase [Psychrobacter sp.]